MLQTPYFFSQPCRGYTMILAVTISMFVTANTGHASLLGDLVVFTGDWVGDDTAIGIAGTDDLTLVLTTALSVTPTFTHDTITLTMTGSANPGNYIPNLDSLSLTSLDRGSDGPILGASAVENLVDPRLTSVGVNFTATSVAIAPVATGGQFSWFPGETIVITLFPRHVPEPATWALSSLGLLWLAGRGKTGRP